MASQKTCPDCSGRRLRRCPVCEGKLRPPGSERPGIKECQRCSGTGQDASPTSGGTGRVPVPPPTAQSA